MPHSLCPMPYAPCPMPYAQKLHPLVGGVFYVGATPTEKQATRSVL
ncbi:MAG: hypothetical protein PUQ00_26040 [Nostoc sp. S13]|nr:hypothetical protein [Nostoc sp. S13]